MTRRKSSQTSLLSPTSRKAQAYAAIDKAATEPANISDPFYSNRMKSHYDNGFITYSELLKATNQSPSHKKG